MNCEGLFQKLGYDCREVGSGILAVSTPFSFADGEPIGFYLSESGKQISLSDNADTLAHFAAIGFEISDRRSWKGIGQTVASFGFSLLESGEIVGKMQGSETQNIVSKYVCAILAVVDHEKEYLGTPEELDTYIKEVEMGLRAWKPQSPLTPFASVQGHSGRIHRFHFDFDDSFVDAAKPHSNRTGAILRKSADVINSGIAKKIMVVMDDREDPDRAKVEIDILSTMISVMPFTTLTAQNRGARDQ